MSLKIRLPFLAATLVFCSTLLSTVGHSATISGLYNTGVNDNGALLGTGAVDPHWQMVSSADASAPGPNSYVVNDTLFPIVSGPWLASGPNSKWIGPMANQSTGNLPGDYVYRTTFDLTGLEPATARLTGAWSSDNVGPEIRLNGVATGFSSDGNFGGLGNTFAITNGFIDGINTLEFVVNNAGTTANPTAVRIEISGTADFQAPPGTPPSIVTHPSSLSVGQLDPATFTVSAYGSRPLSYQWRFKGDPIPGATEASYTIANANAANAGSYDVVVTNEFGMVIGGPATLTVLFLSPAELSYEPPGPSTRRTALTFSEVMYHPTPNADGRRTEFIEIYNSNPFFEDISGWRLSGDVDYTFPANTILQGKSYLVVAPSPADVETVYGITGVLGGFTNNLPNDAGTLRLRKKAGGIVLQLDYSDQPPWPAATDGTGHSLVLVRPSYGENNPIAWAASATKGGSPGTADPIPTGLLENVVINEILAHTDLPQVDYVELFNNSTQPVDLSGCWLSDDALTNKFQIPNGTMLTASGFISFTETQMGFALSAAGETIYFSNPDQTRVIATLTFEGQANGVAFGRSPDGAPAFQQLAARTPDAPNAAPLLRDIVINEIMYHPLSGETDDEYIELFNRGAQPVDLSGWRFVDGINFTFDDSTIIPAQGYLVVARNAARLMTNYSGLNSGNLVGDFGGNLSDAGERVALAMPDTLTSTNATTGAVTTNLFFIVVDEVTYLDGGRWGRWTDGGGSSLELKDAHADNRFPSNWGDSDDTTKAGWTDVEFTGTLDIGTGPSPINANVAASELQVTLFGEGEALVDDVEVIVAGANRIPNPSFESGTTGWFWQGTHRLTSLETGEGYNSDQSLHLRTSDRGDVAANRVRATFSSTLTVGQTATIRAKVRWLRGHPEILFRVKGNYLEAFGRLNIPSNPGTPGAPNSQAIANAGPSITDVSHRPVLPAPGQPIRVSARISDPDGLGSITLKYRVDPSTTLNSVPMVDDGTGGDALAGDGLFTGLIPGQSSGKMVAFRVEASDGAAGAAMTLFPDDAPTRECLVRVGEAVPGGDFGTYRLWMTEASVATWAGREKLSNDDLDVTFVYGNFRAIYNAGAHYSGSPYTSPGYTSPIGSLCGYDISFPDDDPFLSSTHVVMDWPVRDSTNQREQLMFWFLEQYGLPNMYRRYVNMYVNGVKRGTIYDDVQQPNGDTVEEWFNNDSDGDLFKTDCWDEFNANGDRETGCIDLNSLELYVSGGLKKTSRYRWVWKPRAIHGTANDYSKLFALVDAANADNSSYVASMESLADIAHWTRTFAMNDLASFWDAFGNPNAKNTFLYKPQDDRWKLMCWDFDVGLGVFNDPVDAALFPSLNDEAMNRFWATPAFRRLYWQALEEGVNTFFQTGAGTPIDNLLDAKYAAFQASGIGLSSPSSIKSWIAARRAFLLNQLASVAATFAVNGPDIVTTDENLFQLTGAAPVQAAAITVNGVAYPVVWNTVTTWTMRLALATGDNVLTIAAVDRFGQPIANASRTITINYTGTAADPEGIVVINEIMYNPSESNPDAEFLEIFNRSETVSYDLSGWRMNGVDFTFPAGSILTNGQYIVLAKNRTAFAATFGSAIPVFDEYDGNLDDGGETLTLFRPGATPDEELIVDRVTYDDDAPWAAGADGQGPSLQLTDAAQDNARVSNWSEGFGWTLFSYTASVGSQVGTRLSFYFDSPGGDVFLDDIRFETGSVVGGGENILLNNGFEDPQIDPWMFGPLAATNSMVVTDRSHTGNASLHLVVEPGTPALTTFFQTNLVVTPSTVYTLSFWYQSGTTGGNFNMRLNSLFRPTLTIAQVLATPGSRNTSAGTVPPYPLVWLNEIAPNNLTGPVDNAGDHDPWIELYNSGAAPESLDGYYLSDDYNDLTRWPFPASATLGNGQFKIVWGDGEPGETSGDILHTSFRLANPTGSLALSRLVNGEPQIVDYLNYTGLEADQSFGSFPDADPFFRRLLYVTTPGGTNSPAFPSPMVYINEWMASNASAVQDPADQDYDDWFELYNPNDDAVDLTDYYLTDDTANPTKYRIPAGFAIPAHGFLLVWADENGSQNQPGGDLHANFKLSANGESISLYAPNGQLLDSVVFGPQADNVSEGRFPDGAASPFVSMPVFTPRMPNQIAGPAEPVIETITVETASGQATITWMAEPSRTYRVQYKSSLEDPEWTDLPGDVTAPAMGTTASKTDTTINGITQRFYRVLLLP